MARNALDLGTHVDREYLFPMTGIELPASGRVAYTPPRGIIPIVEPGKAPGYRAPGVGGAISYGVMDDARNRQKYQEEAEKRRIEDHVREVERRSKLTPEERKKEDDERREAELEAEERRIARNPYTQGPI